jgi:hypothetical protein
MMKLTILSLVCAVAAFASPGNVENDATIPETELVGVMSKSAAQAAALQGSLSDLKKQYAALQNQMQSGAKATPGVKKTIDAMEDLITNEIEPAIKTAKASDQKLIDAKHSAITGLNLETARTIDELQQRAGDIRADIETHNSLAEELKKYAADYSDAVKSYEKTVHLKTSTCCEKQNSAVPDIEYTPSFAECNYVNDDGMKCVADAKKAIDAAVQAHFEEGEALFKKLDAECKCFSAKVLSERKVLDLANQKCDSGVADCSAKKSEIDEELPEFSRDWDAAESAYGDAYKKATKEYADATKLVKANERDRNNEWDSTQEIKCMLTHYLDGGIFNQELLNLCKKDIDHSFLAINYPPVPAALVWKLPPFAKLRATGSYEKQCNHEEDADEDADKKCLLRKKKPLPECKTPGQEDAPVMCSMEPYKRGWRAPEGVNSPNCEDPSDQKCQYCNFVITEQCGAEFCNSPESPIHGPSSFCNDERFFVEGRDLCDHYGHLEEEGPPMY